jgi:hypothetical protein
VVHMKALSALFNFPYPKVWIRILRYENYNIYPPKSHSAVVLGRRV